METLVKMNTLEVTSIALNTGIVPPPHYLTYFPRCFLVMLLCSLHWFHGIIDKLDKM